MEEFKGLSEETEEGPPTGDPAVTDVEKRGDASPFPKPILLEGEGGSVSGGDTAETYPEGGLQAWLVVAGCWLALLASLGLMNSIGTFQTYVSTHQLSSYSHGTIGWIFSTYTFLSFFLGVYIGPLFDTYGPRWLVSVGVVCLVVSLMLLSLSTGKTLGIRRVA